MCQSGKKGNHGPHSTTGFPLYLHPALYGPGYPWRPCPKATSSPCPNQNKLREKLMGFGARKPWT